MDTYDPLDDEPNYYKENIFNREDFFLFWGVINFYIGDYNKAISDFEQTSDIMHSTKELNWTWANFNLDKGSHYQSQSSS